MRNTTKKIFFIIFILFASTFFTGCTSSEYVSELEYKIDSLESENANLKEKLDYIHSLVIFRHHYDYDELLDEIENNCLH